VAAPRWEAHRADRAAGERLTAVGQQRAQEARNLADELAAQGHPVSANTVAGLLAEMGYSLQATSKCLFLNRRE
jgi:hypothetical protein